jgi:hypothetical protein
MKKLMENWKKFLNNEAKVLKPGEQGWGKYIELVAKAYLSAPKFEDRAVGGYLVMIPDLVKFDKQIKSFVDVKEVPYHPYRSAKGMRKRVKKTGKFMVSTADSEHPIFNNDFKDKILSDDSVFDHYLNVMNSGLPGFNKKLSLEERRILKDKLIPLDFAQANTYFRTVHDFHGHVQGGFGFSKQGEFSSYNRHAKHLKNICVPVLFTEVVGQICCFYYSGKKNCSQKSIILDGFDFFNLGEAKGYSVQDKNLVKVDDDGENLV